MKCKNKCKIEASITEAKVLEEVSNFTIKYYGENLPSLHYPPLVTMQTKMNRASAFSKGNLEVQLMHPPRPYNMQSGAISCYMC
jgi:hypothetical protein